MKLNFSWNSTFISILTVLLISSFILSCKTVEQTTSGESAWEETTFLGDDGDDSKYLGKTYSNSKRTFYYRTIETELPKTPREFRGVWIATVANIDWPTSPNDPYSKQKEDFIKLLDYYQSLNFNTVIVQIRTAGDALYPSNFAPWSRYLTGKEGLKPNTTEDPLSWMILEAHRRGMEFHAWLNPFRATMNLDTEQLSKEHDYFKYPNWMVKYDTKYYYNPGLPEVRSHLVNIIREVVRNYNIDGIHFDDYFYPYKVNNLDFDDEASFKRLARPGQAKDDWRRENVNLLVWEVNELIKKEKPWVQFGISPFGVWRNKEKDPNGSNTRAGQTNYDDLYADVQHWMKNGWIDYLIPQVYWSMDFEPAAYRELTDWWSKNHHNTKIYIGNGPYKIRDNADKAWDNPMEIPNQISLSKTTPNIYGNAFFSAKSMYLKNQDVASLIKEQHFQYPVLPPVANRKVYPAPGINRPNMILHGDGYAFQFKEVIKADYRFAVIYTAPTLKDLQNREEKTRFQKVYLDDNDRFVVPILPKNNQKYIALSFVDRYGVETAPMIFKIQSKVILPAEE